MRGLWAVTILFFAGCGGPTMPLVSGPGGFVGRVGGGGSGSTSQPNYVQDIRPLFQARCGSCHGAGKMHPKDWTDYSTVLANKDLIYQRVVVAKTMPMGAPLDPKDVEIVADWIRAGAPLDGGTEPPAPPSRPSPEPNPPPSNPPQQPTPPSQPSPPETPPPASSPLSFHRDVRPILERNCAVCHFPGGPLANWLDYATALAGKDRIVRRVYAEKTMPPAGVGNMTDSERKLIADWVSSGARD